MKSVTFVVLHVLEACSLRNQFECDAQNVKYEYIKVAVQMTEVLDI